MSLPPLVSRLLSAVQAHDLDGIVGCFAEDYVNQTPAHPARGFRGREQVRRNWQQILAAVPDLRAQVLRSAVDGSEVWSEWEMVGTRADGSAHHLRGVIVLGCLAGADGARDEPLAAWARFYLEPVDAAPTGVDRAVRDQVVR